MLNTITPAKETVTPAKDTVTPTCHCLLRYIKNLFKISSMIVWIYEQQCGIQSKLFITSLVITEYSKSNKKLMGTDLFP